MSPRPPQRPLDCAALLIVGLTLAACGEGAPSEPATPERAAPSEVPGEAPAREPRAPAPPAAHEPPPANLPSAPTSGCALGAPRLVVAGGEWAAIAALDGAFVVAGSAREGTEERAFIAKVELDGTTATRVQSPLEHPAPAGHRRAGPALAVDGQRIALALVDGARRLMLAETTSGGALEWRALGSGASLRFAPALAPSPGAWRVAWTVEAEGAPPHVRLTGARSGAGTGGFALHELRPPGGGAAAPRFLAGDGEPTLFFLDPRAGVSVVHRARALPGRAIEPTVARPLNLVAEPPEIAVVRAGDAEWIAYTAIGSVATSAIGLARLDDSAPPVPLVPGTGYGVLHVDAARLAPDGAVFVADAPTASAPDAPRELHVRALSRAGALSEPAVVRGPAGTAARGRVAHAGEGVIAVAFTSADGVFVAIGRCAIPSTAP